MDFSYKTPQETLSTALNFDNKTKGGSTTASVATGGAAAVAAAATATTDRKGDGLMKRSSANFIKFQQMLKNFNDNILLYPIVTIFIFTILVSVILFQKKLNNTIKFVFVLLYLMFVIFTVFKFKQV